MRNELDDNTAAAATEDDTPSAASPSPSAASPSPIAGQPAGKPQIVKELLIEEVSIDGMCGVY